VMLAMLVTVRLHMSVLATGMNAGFVHKRCDCMQKAQAAQGGRALRSIR
jgi:hypothetical protein